MCGICGIFDAGGGGVFQEPLVAPRCVLGPVTATNVGGIPELVEEGETGFLVLPRDPMAIADRALSLCRDSARRLRMGQAARACVESNFTVQNVTAKLEAIYDRSLRELFGWV